MSKKVSVSKTVNATVEETLRKVVSAIRELDLELETIDSQNGIITFVKLQIGLQLYRYQCVVFDMGDGSTSCTILTIGYDVEGMAREFLDRNKLLGWNSRKYSQKILDRL